MRTNHLVLGGVAALWLGGIAGCGGDDTSSNATTTSTTAASSTSASSSTTGTGGSGATGGGGSGATGGGGGAGGALSGDWTCLGSVTWPPPVKPSITLDLTFVYFMQMTPYPNLTVKACAKADTACAAPLDTKTTDMQGKAQLVVPTGTDGFDGFFDIKGAEIPDSIVFGFPYVGDDTSLTAQLLDSQTLNTFAQISGVTLDPARGHLAGVVSDCTFSTPAPGVSVKASTADASTSQVYVKNQLPSASATETDISGATGIFNLPAGPLTLTSTLVSTKQQTSKVTVLTRAKTLTYTTMPPTP